MSWNYRLCSKTEKIHHHPFEGEPYDEDRVVFSVREVYYNDAGEPFTSTDPLDLDSYESPEGLRKALQFMLDDATNRPVLDLDTIEWASRDTVKWDVVTAHPEEDK